MAARLVFSLILFFAQQIQARPFIEGKYGPEFTFTRNGTVPDAAYEIFIQNLRRHLIWNQPAGAKFFEKVDGNFHTFTSPNGWWFKVTRDFGVVEVKMIPLTVAESKRYAEDIQDAIFVTAANSNLFPWDYLGGGHLNVGLEVFGGDSLLLRNFIVDFWSHNELSMGVMNYDTTNAVPKELLAENSQTKLHAALESTGDEMGAYLKNLSKFQFEAQDKFDRGGRAKNSDLNFGHAGRIEIRAVRPQSSYQVWVNQIELIDNRINHHLRHIRKPLPVQLKVPVRYPLIISEHAPGSNRFVPPVDPQRALAAFYVYVAESRLKWQDHRNYIWPAWITNGELEKFESSKTFGGLQKRWRVCERELR